mmetsp:Transcript_69354/g.201167  ORF Transcript_69354/g.201167 Transcript_69354/m.201167 type:complete len:215 (+) Transcript_69354:352-996(+)
MAAARGKLQRRSRKSQSRKSLRKMGTLCKEHQHCRQGILGLRPLLLTTNVPIDLERHARRRQALPLTVPRGDLTLSPLLLTTSLAKCLERQARRRQALPLMPARGNLGLIPLLLTASAARRLNGKVRWERALPQPTRGYAGNLTLTPVSLQMGFAKSLESYSRRGRALPPTSARGELWRRSRSSPTRAPASRPQHRPGLTMTTTPGKQGRQCPR